MYYISITDGTYYEGERENILDIEVPQRPSPYHSYSKKTKQWYLDNNKVLELKKSILAKLDEDLHTKTVLYNLTAEELEKITREYKEKITILTSTNDIQILQDLLN